MTAINDKNIELFQQLFRRVDEASLLLKNGVFIDCNAAAIEMVGYPNKESLISHSPENLSPPLQPNGKLSVDEIKRHGSLARQKGTHNFDWVRLKYDGSSILLDVSLTVLLLSGEEYIHVLWRDHTERNKKRQIESVNQFIEKMGDAHLVLKNGVYIECNQAAVDMLGYPNKQSLLNLGRENFYPEFQPDGENTYEAVRKQIEKTRKEGTSSTHCTYKRQDGSLLHTIVATTMAIVDDEEVLHVVWRDITHIKQQEKALVESELRFKVLFNNSATAVLTFENGSYTDCNDAALRLLGYSNKEELINRDHPLSPPTQPDGRNSSDKGDEVLAHAYKVGSHQFEWMHQRKNGEVFPVEVQVEILTIN